MKNIKPLFAAAFIFLINIAHAQMAAPTVALTPPPTVAPLVENPYGLVAVWGQGDWVAKTTILLLIIMSLASWYVLVSKLIEQNKLKQMAADAEKAFAKAGSLQQGASAMAATSPATRIASGPIEAPRREAPMSVGTPMRLMVFCMMRLSLRSACGRVGMWLCERQCRPLSFRESRNSHAGCIHACPCFPVLDPLRL